MLNESKEGEGKEEEEEDEDEEEALGGGLGEALEEEEEEGEGEESLRREIALDLERDVSRALNASAAASALEGVREARGEDFEKFEEEKEEEEEEEGDGDELPRRSKDRIKSRSVLSSAERKDDLFVDDDGPVASPPRLPPFFGNLNLPPSELLLLDPPLAVDARLLAALGGRRAPPPSSAWMPALRKASARLGDSIVGRCTSVDASRLCWKDWAEGSDSRRASTSRGHNNISSGGGSGGIGTRN